MSALPIPDSEVLGYPDRRTVGVALAAFLATAALLATAPRFDDPFASPVHRVTHQLTMALWWEGLFLVLLTGAAVNAARGGPLSRTALMVFAVGAGVGVNLGGIGINEGVPGLLFRLAWAVVVGSVLALLVGGSGFVLGRGVAWVRKRLVTRTVH